MLICLNIDTILILFNLMIKSKPTMTKFIHIVAVSTNGVIGCDDKLPWSIPSDLKFFKEKTMDQWCIVGRKTYDGIKHLKNRNFIVVSRQPTTSLDNVKFVDSIDAAIQIAKDMNVVKCYIIGGAEIYRQTFKYVTKLLITYVEKTVVGNAFYEIPSNYNLVKSSDIKSENGNIFYFMQYACEKPYLVDLIELQQDYDKVNPNSGLSIKVGESHDVIHEKMNNFFESKKPE